MSYIEKQSTALVRVKLTDVGREQLAKGQLTFNSYVIGDSEVDYDGGGNWGRFNPHVDDDDYVKGLFSKKKSKKKKNVGKKTFWD